MNRSVLTPLIAIALSVSWSGRGAAQQPPTPQQPPQQQAQQAVPAASQQQAQKPFEPVSGQAGKDVVWVPTPPALVEKMLDMAKVTAQDVVVDLGSGDGRNIIAAAKRGARSRGVEFNPDMVALSRQLAKEAGVADKAQFIEGDMFAADFSDATVLALFLLPDNLSRLKDKFLSLKPGTRIVMNTFTVPEWEPDERESVSGDCSAWCESLIYYVPAKVAGTWRLPEGELSLTQQFQKVSGTLNMGGKSQTISEGRLRGDQITFKVGDAVYTGRVTADGITGSVAAGGNNRQWKAARAATQ